jgi:hypothetical protein
MRLAAPLLALALGLPAAAPAAAQADVFEMRLAGITLGTLTYEGREGGASWRTDLDNTPLGVADGTFIASNQAIRTESGERAIRYEGRTATSRRDRVIEVIHTAERVLSVGVIPDEDATDLSVADRVPERVFDPVEAFQHLLVAEGCPTAFKVYDGRRVVAVTPGTAQQAGGQLSCEMSYDVVAGPGHLSPLGLTSLGVSLLYDRPETGPQILREMDVRTGLFRLRVLR